MDKKSEFENVMKGNSYFKLKKIVSNRENWNPDAVLAAENELRVRDQTILCISEKGMSECSDNEILTLLSDVEKYPEHFIDLIYNEKTNRESMFVAKDKETPDTINLDIINDKEKSQKVFNTQKKATESKNNQINYKVVPFSQSNNISGSLQGIIDSESVNGWRYLNHQYSDKLQPGSSGCFGIGATPDSTIHVGFVIFERN